MDEPPTERLLQLLMPGQRGATVLGARLVGEGDTDASDRPLIAVVFPGLPLWVWEATVAAGPAQDWNRASDAYEVVEWEARGEWAAPTGAPLHEIHATLRRGSRCQDGRHLPG
jgi:hypothetical protein